MSYEPKLLGLLCNWCSYTGADLAGTSRIQYPPNIRIVRLMCSARVDPTFVLEALSKGADGVLLCGFHPGDCHYSEGNYKALRRFTLLKQLYFPSPRKWPRASSRTTPCSSRSRASPGRASIASASRLRACSPPTVKLPPAKSLNTFSTWSMRPSSSWLEKMPRR